jgi:hypothetical protein
MRLAALPDIGGSVELMDLQKHAAVVLQHC